MRECKQLDFSGQTIYAGIDVHKKSWRVSIYTEDFEHKTFAQNPDPRILANYLHRNFPCASYKGVYEAGYSGFWIQKELDQLGIECMVVNPADVPTKDKDKRRKNDKRDSRKLAKSLRSGQLESLYIPTDRALMDRSFIRMRSSVVKDQTRIKNRIKGLLSFYGFDTPSDFSSRYWSGPFINWLYKLEMDYSSGRKTLDSYLRQLVEIRKQLADINRQIREMSRSEYYREKVRLLNTIPGIGKISTMIWLTELIDIKRFKKFDHLCSYVGIVPGEHSSGEKHITTEMDHRGNRVLRTLLIENSWAALRKDTALMMKYAELTKRMTGNRAIIRIARKLLNRIRYVLINEREYEIRKVN